MKIVKYFSFFLAGLVMFASCDINDPILFSGKYLQFSETSKSISFLDTDAAPTTTLTVEYVAEQSSSPVNVTISVVTDQTTVAEGTDFTVPSSIQIPANSNSVTFDVSYTAANFNLFETETIVLELGGDAQGTEWNQLTLNVTKVAPFRIEDFVGTYDVVDTDDEANTYEYQITTALGTEEGTLDITGIWEVDQTVTATMDGDDGTFNIAAGQDYGCYDAGVGFPLCTIFAAFAGREVDAGGSFQNGGAWMHLTSGYTVYIITPPYDTYYFTYACTEAMWTKASSKQDELEFPAKQLQMKKQ